MRLLLSSACLCLLAACTPQAPDEEQRPQPQADAATAPATSAIVQRANVYKDAARDAVQQTQDAADRERAAADASQ